jgi:hypothetical protein
MARRLRRFAEQCGAISIAALLTSAAFGAGSPLDTGGFEPYALGPLYQQTNPGPQQPPKTWVGIDQLGTLTNVVNGAVVQLETANDKVLKVDRIAGVDNRWTVPLGNAFPSHRFMLVDWDMRVIGTGDQNVLGPFFGVEAYDEAGTGGLGLLGTLGVDATTGDVVYQAPVTGALTDTGKTVVLDEWNSFGMVFDFMTDQYSTYLNGERVTMTAFVDANLGLNHFTDADISALAAFNDSASINQTGTAYFDNFRVLDGVPGDFDFDGDVDSVDVGTLKSAFGLNATGDADGDGDADGNDYLIVQRNLGFDATPAVVAIGAVPEPSGSLMVAFVAWHAAMLSRRSMRRQVPSTAHKKHAGQKHQT